MEWNAPQCRLVSLDTLTGITANGSRWERLGFPSDEDMLDWLENNPVGSAETVHDEWR
jgi:hypothetical protein